MPSFLNFFFFKKKKKGRGYAYHCKFKCSILYKSVKPQMLELVTHLERVRLCLSVEDRRVWVVDSSGLFSRCSAFYTVKQQCHSSGSYHSNLWKMSAPSKVKMFARLLLLDKLYTQNALQRIRPFQVLLPGCCVICIKDGEDVDHLFFHCSF